jgi:uncharacterized membrane protein (UPF0182 family)
VAMEETLEKALAVIFELEPAATASRAAAGEREDLSTAELIGEAGTLYRSAQEELRVGNWSGYGQDIDRLGEVISALEERSEAES